MIRFLVAALFAAYNLVALYGIQHWNWDAFQLLILYWTETAILAAWTMVRIALLPDALLGTDDFSHWTLLMAGPRGSYSLFGELVSARTTR